MKQEWHIAVVIPACNEEELLPRCLRSIERARRQLPGSVTSDVIVVSDGSTDATETLARHMLQVAAAHEANQDRARRGGVLSIGAMSVGVARGAGVQAALRRVQESREMSLDRVWIANTDGDCEVPESWLLEHLAAAQCGYAAVAGVVDVDSFEEHQPCVESRFRSSYRTHADHTHPHVHGANLGVRADAYVDVGGWGRLTTAEDHDLWRRLHAAGHRRLSDARLRVVTSGRIIGRAPLGFAGALAAHNEVAV
jgi:glycosyltransferase involved in cell wall biosynthesis